MKVCFIEPEGLDKSLNLGLAYLCSAIKDNKKVDEIKVVDFNNSDENFDDKIKKIKGFDIVGISIKSFSFSNCLKIIRKIRKDNKFVVAGGIHTTIMGEKFLEENIEFDIGIIGEGDKTIIEVINFVLGKKKLKDIDGIIYRKGCKVYATKSRKLINDLDSLNFPDFTFFDSVDMTKKNPIDVYQISTSRGCPYNCSYCVAGRSVGKLWRPRSVENVVSEIIHAKEKYRPIEINIVDDNFSLDMNRAKNILKRLIEKKLDNMTLTFDSGLRADKIDSELMQLIKKVGCNRLILGIESGHPKVLKAIDKGESLKDIKNTIKLAKKNGMKISGFFIIGLPYSNRSTDEYSLKFVKSIKLDKAIWSFLVPYPGTSAWEWVKKNGTFLGDWKDVSALRFEENKNNRIVFETKDYLAKEKIEMFKKANIKCFNYPALFKEDKSIFMNILITIENVIKYDPYNIPKHFMFLIKNLNITLHYITQYS